MSRTCTAFLAVLGLALVGCDVKVENPPGVTVEKRTVIEKPPDIKVEIDK
jgi:Fe2+ transport system protein B